MPLFIALIHGLMSSAPWLKLKGKAPAEVRGSGPLERCCVDAGGSCNDDGLRASQTRKQVWQKENKRSTRVTAVSLPHAGISMIADISRG